MRCPTKHPQHEGYQLGLPQMRRAHLRSLATPCEDSNLGIEGAFSWMGDLEANTKHPICAFFLYTLAKSANSTYLSHTMSDPIVLV